MNKFLPKDSKDRQFASYNNCPHMDVNLPDETCTISVRTPDGNKVTFGFIHRPEGAGHQCVDIVHHSAEVNSNGNPLQTATFLGQGPTIAVTKPQDEVPCTLVVLSLPKE
jgi:hypothetical protein